MKVNLLAAVALFLWGSAPLGASTGSTTLPTITRARADVLAERLTLDGRNFGTSPRVFLGAAAGSLDELEVLSAGSGTLEAKLPAVEPGTYLVVVVRGFLVASIDVTIGAAGPIGPEGPQGPRGETGIPGNLVLAGRTCPPGESVTGFDLAGDLLCTGTPPCMDEDLDGICVPADCNDADPRVFPASPESCDRIDNDCDGETDEGCDKHADVIFVVDSSTGMDEEHTVLENTLHAFAQGLGDQGVLYRIVVIAEADAICVPPPLGSGQCPGSQDTPLLRVVDRSVGSNDALTMVLDAYPQYRDFLTPDAARHIVVVTDDESALPAISFLEQVEALTDPGFPQGFRFHSIVALSEEETEIPLPPPPGFEPCAVAVGEQYKFLSFATGGFTASICSFDSTTLPQLASAIVASFQSPEVCDGADNDGDGSVDEDLGVLSCGLGACFNQVDACVSGVPQQCVPLPAPPEICGNGMDDDCDGTVDEDCP